jgi:hypothetical protein
LGAGAVGAAESVINLQPGQSQDMFFWLFNNHGRYFTTSVFYPDGYHYNRHLYLIITSGFSNPILINDAPVPTVTLENDSMGQPSTEIDEIPSDVAAGQSVGDASGADAVSTYSQNAVVPLKYGKTYEITASSTYSPTQVYTITGTIVPDPGYTYKILTCGMTGVQGQNCGVFQYKNQDGGWDDQFGPPNAP